MMRPCRNVPSERVHVSPLLARSSGCQMLVNPLTPAGLNVPTFTQHSAFSQLRYQPGRFKPCVKVQLKMARIIKHWQVLDLHDPRNLGQETQHLSRA